MGKAGSKMVLKQSSLDGVQSQSIPVTSLESPIIISSSNRMKVKWTQLGLVFFLALSIIMTGCFIWQYHLPKLMPEEDLEIENKTRMCPQFPEPTPLEHPIPYLREALEKVDALLRNTINHTSLPALSAIVIYNDTVLWTGNFGKTNISDPNSAPPNEYTIYRIASVSKIFPTLMLYRLWEDGKVGSLDDPLEKYVETFTIKNPLGKSKNSELKHVTDGLIFLDSGEVQIRSSSVTLRRMAGQLSGLPRTLRSTSLLWNGSTSDAIRLLQDDVLVADPGTKCHYSNLAYSLLPHVLAERVVGLNYQRWITDNILNQLGMEDTGFEFTPDIQSRLAVGVYPSGQPAPLYDLGWYRPTGQMFSTAADLAKLAMTLLGVYRRKILEPDTLKIMLTPLFRCDRAYPANGTGTPWEVYEQLDYVVLRKDGDIDGYSATLSLIPQLKISFVLLMAGSRPQNQDVVTKAYSYVIPAMERALRQAKRAVVPPPDPAPYVGFYTFVNLTHYEIKAESGGILVLQQLGSQPETLMPEKYRTIKLTYLMDRVFKVMFDNEYPCVISVGSALVSLEVQDGQLFNFYMFDKKGLSPGFDVPGLNLYNVVRIPNRPTFAK